MTPDLFTYRPPPGPRDGTTFIPKKDEKRLNTLSDLVWALMKDGQWRTLAEIKTAIGKGSEGGIHARLRDWRKKKFGGHEVPRRRRSEGTHEYRLVPRVA